MNRIGSPTWLAEQRELMVENEVRARGVIDEAVLAAMRCVPREHFIPDEMSATAYEDHPLPIAAGQTISQPYIVALMAAALRVGPDGRVLEIGTGSGYGAAILSRICLEVISVERHRPLVHLARRALADLAYDNVTVVHGDGTLGFVPGAPYDGIVVTAGAPSIPDSLLDQLADGGSLVIPVGTDPRTQTLLRVTRRGEHFEREDLGGVRFVPLIGAEGWSSTDSGREKGHG